MKYYYFVSFACGKNEEIEKGDISFITKTRIRTSEDITSVKQTIMDKFNVTKAIITNIVLLDSEKED